MTIEEKLAIAVKALKFYADQRFWQNDTVDIGVGDQPIPGSSEAAHDQGDYAIYALEQIGESL
jgi:hypothetical protein